VQPFVREAACDLLQGNSLTKGIIYSVAIFELKVLTLLKMSFLEDSW
jgi:hypothetical protein